MDLCCVCRVRESTQLCDGTIGCADPRNAAETAFTCDAPLCLECTFQPWHTLHGHDWDKCPEHAERDLYEMNAQYGVTYREPMTEAQAAATRALIHAACKRPPRLSVITNTPSRPAE